MKADFAELFSQYDAILTPTSPEAARKLGEKSGNPLKGIYHRRRRTITNRASDHGTNAIRPICTQYRTTHRKTIKKHYNSGLGSKLVLFIYSK